MELENGVDIETHRLQIRLLKEKVKNLVSDIDYFREVKQEELRQVSTKMQQEDEETIDVGTEDDFLNVTEEEYMDVSSWLSGAPSPHTSLDQVRRETYGDLETATPEMTDLLVNLRILSRNSDVAVRKVPFDSRTFTRPKKCTSRPSLNTVTPEVKMRPKLHRKLTTTVTPSPNLISHLEALSRTNNRPVSGNWDEDGRVDALADVPSADTRRRSIPASVFERLQALKKANSSTQLAELNGNEDDDDENHLGTQFVTDAQQLKTNLFADASISQSESYFSDDNESFINLEGVSDLCSRLARSIDQSSYNMILSESDMQGMFYQRESRLTIGGQEIPTKLIMEDYQTPEEKEILVDVSVKLDSTFEVEKKRRSDNMMNLTYDAERKPGILEAIKHANINPCSVVNNNTSVFSVEARNLINQTYEKVNGDVSASNEKLYSSRLFDATFKKSKQISPPDKGKKRESAEHSEDDCMSTTSDHSYRSVESTGEGRVEDPRHQDPTAPPRTKKHPVSASTPKAEPSAVRAPQRPLGRFSDGMCSPIRRDGEEETQSQGSSTASSRGTSPGRMAPPDGTHRPQVLRPIKAPVRELKLKPALIQPTDTFKRPGSSVPKQVESKPGSATPLGSRPSTAAPRLSAVPTPTAAPGRLSGIPSRLPSRLKQPQIRSSMYERK